MISIARQGNPFSDWYPGVRHHCSKQIWKYPYPPVEYSFNPICKYAVICIDCHCRGRLIFISRAERAAFYIPLFCFCSLEIRGPLLALCCDDAVLIQEIVPPQLGDVITFLYISSVFSAAFLQVNRSRTLALAFFPHSFSLPGSSKARLMPQAISAGSWALI